MANTSRKSAVAHSRNDEAVRRVLVGDDDQGIRDVLARLLEDEGYEIVTASSGAEALERLTRSEDERPHLALLDIRMPISKASPIYSACSNRAWTSPSS